ncbi:MAG: hypothetical protein RLN76_03885 [Phycisphaeraceae bacterium]
MYLSSYRARLDHVVLSVTVVAFAAGAAHAGLPIADSVSDRVRVVVADGDPIPGVTDTLQFPTDASLNDVGQVAFYASGSVDLSTGVFRAELDRPLVTLARNGQTLPNGANLSGLFSSAGIDPTPFNNAGQVSFTSFYESSDFSITGTGVFIADENGPRFLAQSGDPVGDLQLDLSTTGFGLALNDDGAVALRVNLTNSDLTVFDEGVVLMREGQPASLVARAGQLPSTGLPLSEFPNFGSVSLDSAGQVRFTANRESEPESPDPSNPGVFRGNSNGGLDVLLENGTPTPPGIGSVRVPGDALINPLSANDVGGLAFKTEIQLVNSPGMTSGIFTLDPSGGLREIVRDGTIAPGGGQFTNFNINLFQSRLPFNHSGQVAFNAETAQPGQAGLGNDGLFIGDGVNPIQTIVRRNDQIPSGDGKIGSFERVFLNDSGQVAFSTFVDGSNPGNAIFFYDPNLGLLEVVRSGQLLGGVGVDFFSLIDLNERGQLLFSYNTSAGGGGSGVAIWTVPILGDFNADALIDLADLELLVANYGSADAEFDVAGDGGVAGLSDLTVLVEELIGTFMGDADLDGTVGLVDLSLLAGNFGAFGPSIGWSQGDFDGSGQVTLADLSLLATNFGQTAAVPSPATGVMVGMGLLVLRRR